MFCTMIEASSDTFTNHLIQRALSLSPPPPNTHTQQFSEGEETGTKKHLKCLGTKTVTFISFPTHDLYPLSTQPQSSLGHSTSLSANKCPKLGTSSKCEPLKPLAFCLPSNVWTSHFLTWLPQYGPPSSGMPVHS